MVFDLLLSYKSVISVVNSVLSVVREHINLLDQLPQCHSSRRPVFPKCSYLLSSTTATTIVSRVQEMEP